MKYTSIEGRPIEVLTFGEGPTTILLMAGVHGDEKSGVKLIRQILRKIMKYDPCSLSDRIVVMPLVNPDGYKAGTRRNARNIDIN
ncbi:MAG: succinylglutamate desuccinylase/aspartoacylase family protein, partial [Armatimonadota bacterium]|nr:succinylglutamate desuccinylase/aspartoacylase family protein [Armatimonadota bacterium]